MHGYANLLSNPEVPVPTHPHGLPPIGPEGDPRQHLTEHALRRPPQQHYMVSAEGELPFILGLA